MKIPIIGIDYKPEESPRLGMQRIVKMIESTPTLQEEIDDEKNKFQELNQFLNQVSSKINLVHKIIKNINNLIQSNELNDQLLAPALSFQFNKFYPSAFTKAVGLENGIKSLLIEEDYSDDTFKLIRMSKDGSFQLVQDIIQVFEADYDKYDSSYAYLSQTENIKETKKVIELHEKNFINYSKIDWSK